MKMFVRTVAALSLMAIATVSHGATITLNATVDTWLAYSGTSSNNGYSTTPRGTDTTINVRAGATGTSSTTGSTRMLGVLEFDLGQLPAGATITDAHVQMFMPAAPGSGANSGNGIDKARLIQLSANSINGNPALSFGNADIDPNTLSFITKSDNTTFGYSDNPTAGTSFQATDFVTESFGWYNYATTPIPQDVYTASDGPSANDLAYIQGVYNDSWKKLGVMLDPQDGRTSNSSGNIRDAHFWSSARDTGPNDDESRVPQLVVTYSVPEPSSFVLLAGSMISGLSLLARRRRR